MHVKIFKFYQKHLMLALNATGGCYNSYLRPNLQIILNVAV